MTEERSIVEMVKVYNENRLYDADTGDILEPEMTVAEMRATLDIPCVPVDQIDIPKDMGIRYLTRATGCARRLAEDVWAYSTEYGSVNSLDELLIMMDEHTELEAYNVMVSIGNIKQLWRITIGGYIASKRSKLASVDN